MSQESFITYKFRLRPTKAQYCALDGILESQRQLYNAALEERVACYKATSRTPTYYEQCKSLTQCRSELPEMEAIPLRIQRATLKRLDLAYKAFFQKLSRNREGKLGFPKFKGKKWFNSFGFGEFNGIQIDGKRLRFKGMPGGLRFHMHRPMPKQRITTVSFQKDVKGWLVSFAVAYFMPEQKNGGSSVGVDMGLTYLATLSDGRSIENARFSAKSQREMRKTQRALERCRRGSKRRLKAKTRLYRLHTKIANARRTYLHQRSESLVREFDSISLEVLMIENMKRSASGTVDNPGRSVAAKSGLNRAINDAAWGKFKFMLRYKAKRCGCVVIDVDPRFTSQTCAECGFVAKENRDKKAFKCMSCGHTDDADVNAARVIAHRAVVGPAIANVTRRGERRSRNIAHLEQDTTIASHCETVPVEVCDVLGVDRALARAG